MKPIRILICDDSIAVHESLGTYFRAENIECVSAYDGEQARNLLKLETFDLIILDIMMPKIIGTELCKEIRKTNEVPIIFLSARGEEFDRILGFELGADDYITKPFSPKEVVVRVRSILKRVPPRKIFDDNSSSIYIGNMCIRVDGYEVFIHQKKLDLTPKEVKVLIYFAEHKNKVLTRDQILNNIWGYDYYGDTRAVDTLLKRLRQKLPDTNIGFEIKSIYGVGYKLEVPY